MCTREEIKNKLDFLQEVLLQNGHLRRFTERARQKIKILKKLLSAKKPRNVQWLLRCYENRQ